MASLIRWNPCTFFFVCTWDDTSTRTHLAPLTDIFQKNFLERCERDTMGCNQMRDIIGKFSTGIPEVHLKGKSTIWGDGLWCHAQRARKSIPVHLNDAFKTTGAKTVQASQLPGLLVKFQTNGTSQKLLAKCSLHSSCCSHLKKTRVKGICETQTYFHVYRIVSGTELWMCFAFPWPSLNGMHVCRW